MGRGAERQRQRGAGDEELIRPHGGYRQLKTFQLATVIYDVTARFCEKYLDPRSRTVDQMTQAARSGRQNTAEGSVDSGTSRKIEMKLTGVAKGSLEELRLDYEDYLRQRSLPQWAADHPALGRFKALRCASLDVFRRWVADEMKRAAQDGRNTDRHGRTRTAENDAARVRHSPCSSVPPPRPSATPPCPSVFVANGALSLLNLCIYLLDRQLKAQAAAFERDGGFTERLYSKRTRARREKRN